MVTGTYHFGVNDNFRFGTPCNSHQFPNVVPDTEQERMRSLKKHGFPGNMRINEGKLEYESMYSHRWNPL